MLPLSRTALAILLCLSATVAFADPIDACVDLGAEAQLSRVGEKAVLVKDADNYYRLNVRKGCYDLSFTPKLVVTAEKTKGRVCPSGTRVKTQRDFCDIESVEKIDETAYQSYRRVR
ncbi:DUF6491 family protein [Lysobacter antibioticus]|uniref:DUF6491 family protein n=1 Tax=Lysobacter antibioticus TaxID=84531 RepID=UPI0004D029DE|nr:DUF6491 family protein [Lysobacter antibioticus]